MASPSFPFWLQQVLGATLLMSLMAGCAGGQTGSPDCVPAESCVCDPLLSAGALLRLHVESFEAGRLVAVVDEVLARPEFALDLQPGDRIGGSLRVEKPCERQEPPSIVGGDERLVLFNHGTVGGYPGCTAFSDCAAASCEGLPEPELTDCWNECDEQTRADCEQSRTQALLDGAFGFAVPWEEPLAFGDSHDLPRSEVDVLHDHRTCLARFPADPLPPCNDTVSGPCSVSALASRPQSGSAAPLALLLALLALVSGVRRSYRRKRRR